MGSVAEAYLCQPDYFMALLICLRAVEQNQPAFLADVNPIKVCVYTCIFVV